MEVSNITVYEIPLTHIFADEEFNCRGKIAPIDVADLATDIERNGLLQPVTVMPIVHDAFKYKLVAGYRRYMAYRILRRETIPAIVKDNLSELDACFLNLSENLQRCELNMKQEALAIKKFVDSGMNRADIAAKINRSPGWVQTRTMILEFPEDVQNEIAAGIFGTVDIRNMYTSLRKKGKDAMYDLLRFIKTQKQKGEQATEKYKVIAKEANPDSKRSRTKTEMVSMLDVIFNSIGGCFATRVLAWAAGNVSSNELYAECEEVCKNYNLPPFVRPVVKEEVPEHTEEP